MNEFELLTAESRRDGTIEIVLRARLSIEEFLALGKLQQLPPYPEDSPLDVWLELTAPLCATRLTGFGAPTRDILADTEQHLYEIRALTRLSPADPNLVRAALERELSEVE